MKETKILLEKREYAKGGEIVTDVCYVNYSGYRIQSKRCQEEGVDFIMLGEYRDVSRDLRNNHISDWIYYNRLARIYIDDKMALEFVKEANKHFNPLVDIHPFFYDIDRAFATYHVSSNPQERKLNVGGLTRTDDKPLDKRQQKESERLMKQRLANREKRNPPEIKRHQWKRVGDYYWWIGMVINDGGEQGAYFDKHFKNDIIGKHLPVDNGISLQTLIHEYAHCLDFNNSIKEGKVFKRPIGEMEISTGKDFSGNELSKEAIQDLITQREMFGDQPTLLATHGEFYVSALANILKAGRTGKIPILNKLDKEVYDIEVKIGGKDYAMEQRERERVEFLQSMQKRVDAENTPYLRHELPLSFKKFLQETDGSYLSEFSRKQINLDVALVLLPYVKMYEAGLKDQIDLSPTRIRSILEKMKRIEIDIRRLIRRIGQD